MSLLCELRRKLATFDACPRKSQSLAQPLRIVSEAL